MTIFLQSFDFNTKIYDQIFGIHYTIIIDNISYSCN